MTIDEERELRELEELERLENLRVIEGYEMDEEEEEAERKFIERYHRIAAEDFDPEKMYSEAQPFEQGQLAQMAEYQTLEKSCREALAALKCNLSEPMRTQLKILLVSGAAMGKCRDRHFFRQGVFVFSVHMGRALEKAAELSEMLNRQEREEEKK